MKSGIIAINIAAIIFGSAALYGKLNISPVWIVACRGAFAALALFIFGMFHGGLTPLKKIEPIKDLIFTGGLLTIHWVTFFISVQLSGIAIATLTFATFPFFTVLFTSIQTKRFPNLIEIGAGITIVFAVTLLVDVKASESVFLGAMSGMMSAFTFAYFGLSSKKLTLLLPSLTVSLVQNVVVTLILLPFLSFASPVPNTFSDWSCLIALGIVTTALMHQLYLFALSKLSATTCSGFVALEPVYAILFSALFFGEHITILAVISGLLILSSSMALLYSENSSKVH